MTIALPAESAVQRRTFRIDFSWPVLIAFAALLCVLIVLPMSWLVYYSVVDKAGHFTLDNFATLVTEPEFRAPMVTTLILATSASIFCCLAAAPMGWLVARTDLPFSESGARAGDGVVRHAAVPRRDRLGAAGGAQFGPAQQALPPRHRRGDGRPHLQHLYADRADLRRLLLHLPLHLRAGRQRARPHPGRPRGRLLDARRPHLDHRAPHHHSAGLAGAARRHADRLPAGDDAVRLAGDPRAAGGLPHHDHQDLEPVPVPAQAGARGGGLAAAARAHRDAAARPAHDPRPQGLFGGRRQDRRSAAHPARHLEMAGGGLRLRRADAAGVPAVFRAVSTPRCRRSRPRW